MAATVPTLAPVTGNPSVTYETVVPIGTVPTVAPVASDVTAVPISQGAVNRDSDDYGGVVTKTATPTPPTPNLTPNTTVPTLPPTTVTTVATPTPNLTQNTTLTTPPTTVASDPDPAPDDHEVGPALRGAGRRRARGRGAGPAADPAITSLFSAFDRATQP